MTQHSVCVDISELHFDAFDLQNARDARFDSLKPGYRKFRKRLGTRKIGRIVYAATGAHYGPFELALEVDFPLVKVNPFQARRFAEAREPRAKTDPADARSLAAMGKAFDLVAAPPKSRNQRLLIDLHLARSKMMRERVRLLTRRSQLVARKTATITGNELKPHGFLSATT